MPKVSVIMPLYNAEKYVKKAIDSILEQTFSNFELILIDDCSMDKTMDIVMKINDPRIVILNNAQNRGIAFSRNRGIENSKGQYIAFMDDDDLTASDRLEKEVKFLDNNKDIDVVGGRFCIIDENDSIVQIMGEPLVNPHFIRASLMFFDPIGNGSTMFRKELIMKNDIRFQEGCLGMEDYRFWIDCSLHGKITNINKVLLYWRNSLDNESARVTGSTFSRLRAEKFSELQKYALQANGFQLNEAEIHLLQDMFPEGMTTKPATAEELEKLLRVFKKMIIQAEKMNLENREEIVILCKKQYAKKIENASIWM